MKSGEVRPAVVRDGEFGWICEECSREIGQSRSSERTYAAQYAYACGYRD